MTAAPDRLRLEVDGRPVSALCLRPRGARHLLVLGSGAGAGMTHPFMESLAAALGAVGVATLRYQFPYAEAGRRRPDPPRLLQAAVARAVEEGRRRARGRLTLLAGGKSMGGRMTSLLASGEGLPGVAGLVFVGFPLHAAGRPSAERGEHLSAVRTPMLFLQGTRDALADLSLVRPLCRRLGRRARLHVVEGADHGFHVLVRSGRTDGDVVTELASVVASFADDLAAFRPG